MGSDEAARPSGATLLLIRACRPDNHKATSLNWCMLPVNRPAVFVFKRPHAVILRGRMMGWGHEAANKNQRILRVRSSVGARLAESGCYQYSVHDSDNIGFFWQISPTPSYVRPHRHGAASGREHVAYF